MTVRVGVGYDVHRLAGGNPFILGGVRIDYPLGPVGHSDGDVLIHAVIDALLGAAALGDIGAHFPDVDTQWRGIASTVLLEHTCRMIDTAGYKVGNVDATVVLERPKLAPYMQQMRQALADTMKIAVDQVSVKAKTNEGLDAAGRGQAVVAHAVALLERP